MKTETQTTNFSSDTTTMHCHYNNLNDGIFEKLLEADVDDHEGENILHNPHGHYAEYADL